MKYNLMKDVEVIKNAIKPLSDAIRTDIFTILEVSVILAITFYVLNSVEYSTGYDLSRHKMTALILACLVCCVLISARLI
jgi:hypothetical protein